LKSDGDGTWTLDPGYTDRTGTDWRNFAVRAGEVGAGGSKALIWADTVTSVNQVTVGQWNGSDFTFPATIQQAMLDRGTLVSVPLDIEVADVEGDGDADIIWNLRDATVNNVYVSLGNGDGTFDFSTVKVQHPDQSTNWSQYQMFAGDVNGDGREDIIWVWPGATNRVYTAVGKH
jgi:hypothetical protein